MTPNTLRHTAATWLAQDGVDLWEIAKRLGHKDLRMAMETYAHWHPDYQRKSTEVLGRRMTDLLSNSCRGKE